MAGITQELEEVKQDVKLIMTNHLPHIQAELAVHSSSLKNIFWVLMAVGGALIANLISSFFK